ncbi:MAG: polysaccharide biosynthesis C-terminal domain-containing protein [Rhizobiaceae bacterium]|nr:polysaccharide biosynthesis C-terminal domain-containing protein [Rhizobiaceae bacterium]
MSAEEGRNRRLAGIAARLATLARNPALHGIAGVFVMKAAIILANFSLIMLAARVLDTDGFGVFSVLFAAAGLFAVIASLGQNVSIMRWWNEYTAAGDTATLKGSLIFSITTVLVGCAVVGTGFFAWKAYAYDWLLTTAVTLYMIALVIVTVSAHLVRTAIGVGIGDGFGNLMVSVPALLYLAVVFATGASGSATYVFFVFAAGGAACVVLHAILMRRKMRAILPDFASVRPRFHLAEWRARSFKLWVSSGLEAVNQYLDVIIISYLLSPAVAGAYFVTTRLANIFATVSDSMHMFSTRHIPGLYYRRQFGELNSLLNSVAIITLAVTVGGLAFVLVTGQFLLGIFNEEYVAYYPALAILCIGTAAVAAAGPSGSILMLTGHEGSYLRIVAASVLVRAIGFFALIPFFGIIGAVSATTISFILMTAMLRHSAKRLTGLDGSVFRLMGQRNRQAAGE